MTFPTARSYYPCLRPSVAQFRISAERERGRERSRSGSYHQWRAAGGRRCGTGDGRLISPCAAVAAHLRAHGVTRIAQKNGRSRRLLLHLRDERRCSEAEGWTWLRWGELGTVNTRRGGLERETIERRRGDGCAGTDIPHRPAVRVAEIPPAGAQSEEASSSRLRKTRGR